MIYDTEREAYDRELRKYGFEEEQVSNICSKIGDFYVVLYTDVELMSMAEVKKDDE